MKFHRLFTIILVISMGLPVSAHAGWELYDDFNSGTLDPQKWSVDNSSADFTVENGRAKVIHKIGRPNDSSYLNLIQNPVNVLGIKATVFIASCTGDVRTRIAANIGNVGENHVWTGFQLQPGDERIYTNAGLEGPPPTYTWANDLHYAQFQEPIAVIGTNFNLTMKFSDDKITYEVDGLGKISYKYATPMDPTTNTFRGIGTRSTNGDGPCTVYIDDVYVYRP
jgi:hypothetical protein